MIYLADVVDEFNLALKAWLPSFQTANYLGISNSITLKTSDGKSITVPSVFEKNVYDGKLIVNDDRFPFTVFYRAISSSGANRAIDSYGDGNTRSLIISTDFEMILMGFKSKIKVCPIQLMASIVDASPSVFSKQDVKIQSSVSWISSNWDYRGVFNQNFQGVSYNIGPNEFIISSRFRLEQSYFKGCLKNCEC